MKHYLYLAIAIVAEVLATSALKRTDQFTRLWPSLLVIVGYLTAFYLLTIVIETIPVGVAYAIWSGLGIVLVALVARFLYGQTLDWPAIIGMGLIITGALVMNLFSQAVPH